jgi:phosphate transport system permease protein
MRSQLRPILDKAFTILALTSVVLVTVSLAVILAPMLSRGAGAVVFRGTVEFRRMQLNEFHRGDARAVEAELAKAGPHRAPVFALVDEFMRGIDVSRLRSEAKHVYRELGKQLINRNTPKADHRAVRRAARKLRNAFLQALETTDKAEAASHLKTVLAGRDDRRLRGTMAERYFDMAADYQTVIASVDLTRRPDYAKSLAEVQEILTKLFGPRLGEKLPALTMDRYGATRWDQARSLLDRLLWSEQWRTAEPGQPLSKQRVRRQTLFAGTSLAALFPMVEKGVENMLAPRLTVYWQYFIDDSTSGHYFGGVGPEILAQLPQYCGNRSI